MPKSLKITLIILGALVSIVVLDTIQARLFKNSPIISWQEKLDGDSYVAKGILMDTYYCTKDKDTVNMSWHFKTSKYNCPLNNNSKKVSLGVIDNKLTNSIPLNNENSAVILDLFNKYEYTTETCDGLASYNLIIDDITYGIEVYNHLTPEIKRELHITTAGKEIVLNEEDSLKLLKIINTYVPDNYKPLVACLKERLGAYIADESLEFKEKDITSLIKIDKTKLDYSYLKTNEHDGFYLIVKTSDNNVLNDIKNLLASKYKHLNSLSYQDYELYVSNGQDAVLNAEDLTMCNIN